jgi:predicted glycogen debranching enzyme
MAELPPAERWSGEWLEADGLGGFASGTVAGARTRRYHALLLAATRPPSGRMVLVNGLEVWLETAAGHFALSTQRYTPDVTYPDGDRRIVAFRADPWPCWTFRAEDGTELTQEIVARHGHPEVALRWRLAPGGRQRGHRAFVGWRRHAAGEQPYPRRDQEQRG